MKLIDEREWKALYDEMEDRCIVWGQYDKGYLDALNCVDDWFDAQPNVEMEPVKHGEWISVTEIHEAIMNHIEELEDVVLINGYAGALRIIHNLPTVDVEPVRRGQWINPRIIVGGFAEEWGADCSCCGKTHVGNRTAYCPNCGARMNAERRKE